MEGEGRVHGGSHQSLRSAILGWLRPVRRPLRGVAQFGSALRSGRRGRRFKSCHPDCVVSQVIGNGPNLRVRSVSVSGGWVLGCAGGLVVTVWVEDQVAQEFSGGGVDDSDV